MNKAIYDFIFCLKELKKLKELRELKKLKELRELKNPRIKMSTKLIDKIYLDKNDFLDEVTDAWNYFLTGIGNKTPIISKIIDKCFLKIEPFIANRFIVMENDWVYDNQVVACWIGLTGNYEYKKITPKSKIEEIIKNSDFDIPTYEEIKKLVSLGSNTPFLIYNGVPKELYAGRVLFKESNSTLKGFSLADNHSSLDYEAKFLPIKRFSIENAQMIDSKLVLFLFLFNNLTPIVLKEDEDYKFLSNFIHTINNQNGVLKVDLKNNPQINFPKQQVIYNLLNEDKVRADIKEYNQKILEDIEQGHWSLWDDESNQNKKIILTLNNSKLVARDPISSIKDGIVGIDFGTKSTVVVYQEDTTKINPMRIGTGDLSKAVSKNHYENPTVIEFNDIESFISKYHQKKGRPKTRWSDITISHTAVNSMLASKSEDYSSYFSELKQWAGNKNKKLKILDKNGLVVDIPSFLEINDELNPIEIYAYYLGLYINNQHNGIFLNYILSFPVTYEVEIRDKIIESFRKGIEKSLPIGLHKPEILEKLSIIKGASEPAAYAVVALQKYGFTPSDDEKIFYGIFDFGGGTTDFDFGFWREARGAKEARYDYVIEHFGAGGDKYLGGENILELLAFEVFKSNKDVLLQNQIQFIQPPETEKFIGSETLIALSQEAKMNTKTLMEKLRPLWEGQEERLQEFNNGVLGVNIIDINGKQFANFQLKINKDEILKLIENRIKKGVINFFESLRLAFNNDNCSNVNQVNIFLAGNSSKSQIVSKLFGEEIERVKNEIKETFHSNSEEFFKIYQPLGIDNLDLEEPNGKTGVAFGLIETRKSGSILVIDHNLKEDINFKYYLGLQKKKKFKTLIDRETEYNKWNMIIDASEKSFELFYTTQPLASRNDLDINDNSVKKMIISIDKIEENGFIFIRVIEPSAFEYVVANEEDIKNGNYLSGLKRVEL